MAAATYSPDAYSSLPGLHSANQQLQAKGGESIISGPIRDIFLSNKVHDTLGVALLHKHFQIQSNQRLVDIRNVSSPWETGVDTEPVLPKYDGVIVPRSLRFRNERWEPYEFDFSARESWKIPNTRFLAELSEFLDQHDLEDVLGIRLLESRDPEISVEVTEGTSNIMLPKGAVEEKSLIPAMWVFGYDEDDRCNCREYCFTDRSGNHTGSTHGCG